MNNDRTLIIVSAAVCFIIACVTGLTAYGRDIDSIVQFILVILPLTIGQIITIRKVEQVEQQTNGELNRRLAKQTDDIKRHLDSKEKTNA